MKNTFTPVFGVQTRAMAEMQALGSNKEMFPHGVNTSMGDFSWCLAHDLASEQRVGRFDTSSYALGSSVPVMIFMGKEESNERGQKRRHGSVEICETLPPAKTSRGVGEKRAQFSVSPWWQNSGGRTVVGEQ